MENIVYKVWDTLTGTWMKSGCRAGTNKSPGKMWQSVGHLKQALTYQIGRIAYYRRKGHIDQYKNLLNHVVGDREVVMYEVKEIGRIPLEDWYRANGGKL